MDISYNLSQIKRILIKDIPCEEKVKQIGFSMPIKEMHMFISSKIYLLEMANQSKAVKFRLLCTLNSNLMIYAWSNVQYNFTNIVDIHQTVYKEKWKDSKIDYSLEELPEVIDNAERWLKSVKNNPSNSGSPYMISNLQLMTV